MDFRIGILPPEIKKTEAMNESIKFTADSPVGKYAADDTGVMVAVCRDYNDRPVAIIRLADESYVEAPLAHIEHVSD